MALLLLCPSLLPAACPKGYPTISEEYGSSVMVLVGRVDAHRETPAPGDGLLDGDTYTVVPVRVLKGKPASRVELFSENSSGQFPMRVGRKYLLFIYEELGLLLVDNCGNSDMMPHAKRALAQAIAVAARGPDSATAFNSLHDADTSINWNTGSAKTADFDCDGRADTAMLGSKKDRTVVGIVWGTVKKRTQIITLPTGTPAQSGSHVRARKIDTLPYDCKDEDGRPLVGCKVIPACRQLIVREDQTAAAFYWDSSEGTLTSYHLDVSPRQ